RNTQYAIGSVLAEEGALVELPAEQVELVLHAPVVDPVADAHDEPADQRRLDVHLQADLLARARLERPFELLLLLGAQRARRPDVGLNDAEALVPERTVGTDDGRQQILTLLLDEEPDEPQR